MKRGCLWIVGILVVLGVLGAIFGGGSKQQSAGVAVPTKAAVAAAATAVPQNKPTMTKAEFEQIQNGMTYPEVTAIIGGPGEMISELNAPGSPYYTVSYKYDGEGSIGANSMLMFQGGKMSTKAQFGLK